MRLPRRRPRTPPAPQWVVVAFARHEPEADFICNLLREHGVSAYHRRAMGVDVPDFLATGRRVVLVPEDRALFARELIDPAHTDAAADESP
jgi:hypothetical protein